MTNKHDDFENQLDAIRVQIYEETKGMSSAEAVERMNERARQTAKEFGFQIVKSEASQPTQRTNKK